MPSAAYFSRFGIHAFPGLIPAPTCDAVRAALDRATPAAGMVWNPHRGAHVSDTKRRTEFAGVDPAVHDDVVSRLEAVRPEAAALSGVPLRELQLPIGFVRYEVGDFYGIHRDATPLAEAGPLMRERKLSVVVFLNDQSEDGEEGTYGGGRLTFHGLIDEPPWNLTGHPLDAEQGLAIMFDPLLAHEVTPVTAGVRDTVIAWFR